MSRKILVLEASPRRNGNSDRLAAAFIKGAEEIGNRITVIKTTELEIGGCKACNGCWNHGGNCIFKDGMAVIQEELEKADVLVVSTPLYWSMVPSELKAVIDRVYQYDPTHGGKHLAIREAVLLACGETENEKDFDMVKNFFRGFAEFNGMCVKHMLAVPKVNQKGDIEGNLSLKEAENIGKSLS